MSRVLLKGMAACTVVLLLAGTVNGELIYDVPAGTAAAEYDGAGNILLEVDGVALYQVSVGDAAGNELLGTDILSHDGGLGGPINWAVPFSGHQDWVDPPAPSENFGELMTSNFITKEPQYDTWVNVNLGGLEPDVKLWLMYNTAGGSAVVTEIVPEPSTLVLLAVGVLGLLGFAGRRRRKS